MIYRPHAVDYLLSQVPEWLQIEGLKAIKEECDRWKRGDLTKEERECIRLARKLGRQAAKTREEIATSIILNANT